MLFSIKRVLIFSTTFFRNISLSTKNWVRYGHRHIRAFMQITVIFVKFGITLNFLNNFSKNTEISNFMKIRPVGAKLFHADGQTDRHDEVDSVFFAIIRKRPKIIAFWKTFLTNGTVMTPKSLDFTIRLDLMMFLFIMLPGIVCHFPLKVRLRWAIPAPLPQVPPFSCSLWLVSHVCDLNISNIQLLSHARFRSATVTEPNVIVFISHPGLGGQPLFYEISNPIGEPIKFPFVLLLGWDNQSVLQRGYYLHDRVLFRCRAGKRNYNFLQTEDNFWGPGSVGKWLQEVRWYLHQVLALRMCAVTLPVLHMPSWRGFSLSIETTL